MPVAALVELSLGPLIRLIADELVAQRLSRCGPRVVVKAPRHQPRVKQTLEIWVYRPEGGVGRRPCLQSNIKKFFNWWDNRTV